ncbi:hypothetical protein RUND412_004274 [Rhizina undulata]
MDKKNREEWLFENTVAKGDTCLDWTLPMAVSTLTTFNKYEFNINKKRKQKIQRWHTFVVIYKGGVLGVFDPNYDYTRNYSKLHELRQLLKDILFSSYVPLGLNLTS